MEKIPLFKYGLSIAFLFLFLAFHVSLSAQVVGETYLCPASGSTTINACSGIIYDAGGNGDCPEGADGYTIIYPATEGCRVRVTGTYDTEDRLLLSDDVITIYDGAGTSGSTLFSDAGSGNIDVVSSSGPLTVRLVTRSNLLGDDIVNYSGGFELNITCDGGCECSVPTNISVVQGDYGVDISWTGTSQSYIIEYGPAGFTPGTGTTVVVNGTTYTVMGLTTYATYDFYIYYDCGNDGVVTNEGPAFVSFCVPDGSSCIDFSDLNAPNITCTTGFTNVSGPYTTVGVVDNGPASSSSQHTIHRTLELDPRTGYQLSTIPPCEMYSVRLGNWEVDYGCESISYDYMVDTTIGDILLLKYAAVLENPEHDADEQPRFDFEILDQNNNQIDPECGYASFISNVNLGWHQVGSGDDMVLWKDWTNVGFDVTAYHGQVVRVRLTTYDCDQGGHFGYAYFTLNCKRKVITAEACGETPTNTFVAPAGFNYNWYYANNPGNTISTDQSVTLSTSGGQGNLYCHVSFLNNPNCGFDLHTSLEPRYPMASFEPVADSCGLTYTFNNTSTITYDEVNPSPNNEPCETAHWDFGDGTTSDAYNPQHTFPSGGTYTVTLVAGLSDDACQDTYTMTITTGSIAPILNGPTDICSGSPATLTAGGGDSYQWSENGNVIGNSPSITVSPETNTTYTVVITAGNGCVMTLTHDITVHDSYQTDITDEICLGKPYGRNGFNLSAQNEVGQFTYNRTIPSSLGCDSTITLTLNVQPSPNAYLGPNATHCFDEEGEFVLTVPDGDCESYLWNTGDVTQSISVVEGGTYSVTATKAGCTEKGVITLTNRCPFYFYLPNCITPSDHDGINDVFYLPSTKDIVEFEIFIYNRWGKLIFTSKDPHFRWDGRINGKLDVNETYTYRIDLKSKYESRKRIKGIITVL